METTHKNEIKSQKSSLASFPLKDKLSQTLTSQLKVKRENDTTGFKYLSCPIPEYAVIPYLNQLKNYLVEKFGENRGEKKYDLYTKNKLKRDGNEYHVTLCVRHEVAEIKEKIDPEKIEGIDLKFIGIGSAQDKGSITYFIVVESESFNQRREQYFLPKKDFHITLGFDPTDVFTKPKDRSSLIK